MAIHKKRTEEITNALLLESTEPVALPPATLDEAAVDAQFEQYKAFVPELLDALRAGATAEIVPVIKDGSTFTIHGRTKTFWVKIWHRAGSEMTAIEKVQVLNALPSMRNVRIVLPNNDN